MKPLVSVTCIAFNHAKYIRDALDGFVMQKTDFPFEVIVHDDASTDGTADIIREYAEKYPELIVPILQTENQYSKGVPLLENLYSKARGEYIAICEGDDYWTDPLKLQKQVDALRAHPEIDICAACADLTRNEASYGKCAPAEEDTVFTADEVIRGGGGFVATCSLMIRTDVMLSVPEFRKIASFDYVIQIHGALRGGMLYLSDCMSVFRTFANGSWTDSYFKNRDKRIAFNEKMRRMLLKLDEETGGKHSEVIRYKLKDMEFYHYSDEGEFRKMLSPEYKEVFDNLPLKNKIVLYLKCMFPWMVRLLRKLK